MDPNMRLLTIIMHRHPPVCDRILDFDGDEMNVWKPSCIEYKENEINILKPQNEDRKDDDQNDRKIPYIEYDEDEYTRQPLDGEEDEYDQLIFRKPLNFIVEYKPSKNIGDAKDHDGDSVMTNYNSKQDDNIQIKTGIMCQINVNPNNNKPRSIYSPMTRFKPQFKIILACWVMPKITSYNECWVRTPRFPLFIHINFEVEDMNDDDIKSITI